MTAKLDPATGPLSREEFAALIAAPAGVALRAIRKHDPMWGRATGEAVKWKVRFSREVRYTEEGYATVEASSGEEALEIAASIPDKEIKGGGDDGNYITEDWGAESAELEA